MNRSFHGLILAAALIASGTIWSGQVSAQGLPGARPAAVRRLTLVVSDIDKAIDFYQRVGLVKASDKATAESDQAGVFGAAELPLTADSKTSRIVVMSSGDEQSLALLTYDHPPLPSAKGNLLGLGTGDVIIGIAVPDIEGAYSRLNQIGVRFPLPPTRFTAGDGSGQTGRHMYAYDPDGRMIEISQMDARR